MDFQELTGRSSTHLTKFDAHNLVHTECIGELNSLKSELESLHFDMRLASSFRSFDTQLKMWNEKALGKRPLYDTDQTLLDASTLSEVELMWAILHWSAPPGASRHHWGTDFDLYDHAQYTDGKVLKLEAHEYTHGGENYDLVTYLANNQSILFNPFGQNGTGYQWEPWHFSHLKCSNKLLKLYTFEVFKKNIEISSNLELKRPLLQNLNKIYENYILIDSIVY